MGGRCSTIPSDSTRSNPIQPATPSHRPQVKANKRYAGADGFTISECADKVAKDIGKIDILVG